MGDVVEGSNWVREAPSSFQVESCKNLSPQRFSSAYLRGNRPVVLRGGISHWPAISSWTSDKFRRDFGDIKVALSGETFHPIKGMSLAAYIDLLDEYAVMGKEQWLSRAPAPYFRYSWPGQLDAEAFEPLAFEVLKADWTRPGFLPGSGYLMPFRPGSLRHELDHYPEWSVFLSPKGALTRLHVDSHDSNAVLAQVRGRKTGFLFPPGQKIVARPAAGLLPKIDETAAFVFDGMVPSFPGLRFYRFDIGPGDILFIPKRWAHEVYTMEASFSLTFNFIHLSEVDWAHVSYRVRHIGKSPYES